MLRCEKCKRVTKRGEATGLFIVQEIWTDVDGRKHKDIIRSFKTCINCSGARVLKMESKLN
jgi:hypothetical protein